MSPLINRVIDPLWKEIFGRTKEELWAAQPTLLQASVMTVCQGKSDLPPQDS